MEISAKGRFPRRRSVLVFAPLLPRPVQAIARYFLAVSNYAGLAQECADGAGKFLEFFDRFPGGRGLKKVSAAREAMPARNRPIQDPRQLTKKSREQCFVLIPQEAIGQ